MRISGEKEIVRGKTEGRTVLMQGKPNLQQQTTYVREYLGWIARKEGETGKRRKGNKREYRAFHRGGKGISSGRRY